MLSTNAEMDYEKVAKLTRETFADSGDIKAAVAALHFILFNSAKYNVPEETVVLEVSQLGLPKENSDALGRPYRENKEALRDALASQAYSHSRLLNMDWRIDCVLGSSTMPSFDPPVPSVQLRLRIDTAPHKGGGDSSSSSSNGDGAPPADGVRVKDTAFEMTADKFRVFYQELKQARDLMNQLEG